VKQASWFQADLCGLLFLLRQGCGGRDVAAVQLRVDLACGLTEWKFTLSRKRDLSILGEGQGVVMASGNP
jgi:hypothetical protein